MSAPAAVLRVGSGAHQVALLVGNVVTWLLVLLLRIYQVGISPAFAPTCRFAPSCSAYAVGALQRHGPVRGTMLAVRRVLRCHPWNPGGPDPVPPARPRTGA